MRRVTLIWTAFAVSLFLASEAVAEAKTPADAARIALSVGCLPMVWGDDPRAMERAIRTGDLKAGPPAGVEPALLKKLTEFPTRPKVTLAHLDLMQGRLLVVSAPSIRMCGVALLGVAGDATEAEIDNWFNGPPAPFSRVLDQRSNKLMLRRYLSRSQTADVELRTTTVKSSNFPAPGESAAQSVGFLATLAVVR